MGAEPPELPDPPDPRTGTEEDAPAPDAAPRPKVESARVTAKGRSRGPGSKSRNPAVRAESAAKAATGRYTPPADRRDQLPSPWWVPTLMFGLLVAGALVIVLNYLGALGEVDNIKLVVGLVLILGGIVAATQYR